MVFPVRPVLFNHNILNTKAINHFQANHILIRFVFPPLYTPANEVQHFEEPEILAERYNDVLYKKHQHLRIESYKEHFYIKEYEDHVRNIISNLLKHAENGIRNYVNSVESWIRTPEINIDSEEKKEAIKTLFKA